MFGKFIRSAVSIALMLMLVTPAFTHSTTSENTAYWIDPAKNLVAIIMTQVRPVSSDINERFQILVYQALE